MSTDALIKSLFQFIQKSPTAWHAVHALKGQLDSCGFHALDERDEWNLEPSKAYYTTRNDSSICAFIMPKRKPSSSILLGSHTDSPALKLKPNAVRVKNGCILLNPEVYGGPTLTSWFNRELGIAGRVFTEKSGKPHAQLYHLDRAVAVIPHLAIHLDSTLGNEHNINKQDHLGALCGLLDDPDTGSLTLHDLLRSSLPKGKILSEELYLVPIDHPRLSGMQSEFISSYRLDNLLSVHAGIEAFLQERAAKAECLKVFVSWDNEEVGSETAQGAASTFLPDVLHRICESYDMRSSERIRLYQSSLLLSNDAAHAVHPNFAEKYEPEHQPKLGGGPVLKVNAQQRYASDGESIARLRLAASRAKIPLQSFVVRNDSRCGSTIGPISATRLGIRTVDLGAPILSMHAARELGCVLDHALMVNLLRSILS